MLPLELLSYIIDCLRLSNPPYVDGYFKQLNWIERYHRNATYTTLRAVCLANKSLCKIAQPLLFSNITLGRIMGECNTSERSVKCLLRLDSLEYLLERSEDRWYWPKTVAVGQTDGLEDEPGLSFMDVFEADLDIETTSVRILARLQGVEQLLIKNMTIERSLQKEIVRICSLRSLLILDVFELELELASEDPLAIDAFDCTHPVDRSSKHVTEISIGGAEMDLQIYIWLLSLIASPSVQVLRIPGSEATSCILQAVSQQTDPIDLSHLNKIVMHQPLRSELTAFGAFAELCPGVWNLEMEGDMGSYRSHPLWNAAAKSSIFPLLRRYTGGSAIAQDLIRGKAITDITLKFGKNKGRLTPKKLLSLNSSASKILKLELHNIVWDDEFLRHILKACPLVPHLTVTFDVFPTEYMDWIRDDFVTEVQGFTELRYISLGAISKNRQLNWNRHLQDAAFLQLIESGHTLQEVAFGDGWIRDLELASNEPQERSPGWDEDTEYFWSLILL